jgi:hypothetical protein
MDWLKATAQSMAMGCSGLRFQGRLDRKPRIAQLPALPRLLVEIRSDMDQPE